MTLPITRILNCPPPEVLSQLATGSLNEEHAGQLFAHIDSCEICQSKMDKLSEQSDDLVAAARRKTEDIDQHRLSGLIRKAQKIGADVASEAPAVREAISLEGFVSGLRRCGLFPDEEVDALLSEVSSTDSSSSIAKELVVKQKLTPFQARVLLKGRWKGLVLGNYIILEKLGQGGMGSVFKAKHSRLGRIVCVKVVNSAGRKSPNMLERFRNEARTVAALSHPNFVVAHDADEAEGVPFLVMEYVEGKDLAKQVAASGPLTVNYALRIIHQAAIALQYAHDQGVTHRDIKPHNLLVAEDSESDELAVKILDLGLARFDSLLGENTDASTHAAMTNTGVIMGTVDYMSPEQALRSRDADNRSDIYSLGCTLHFLATGQAVFDGDTLMARLIAHREAEVPSLEKRCPGAPPGLDSVFRRMLAKLPDQRYQSMDAVAADFEALLTGKTPLAAAGDQTPQPESVLARRRRHKRRPAYKMWLAVCAMICAIAGSVWAAMQQHDEDVTSGEAVAASAQPYDQPLQPSADAVSVAEHVRDRIPNILRDSFFSGPANKEAATCRAVAILPKKFNYKEFQALQTACDAQGVELAIATPGEESVTAVQDPDFMLSPDVALKAITVDDYDMAFLVGGSVDDFKELYEKGTLASFLHSSGGMGRVVGATSEQARSVFDHVEYFASCQRHEHDGVVHSRVYGTNGAIVYTRDNNSIDELVHRSVNIRKATLIAARTDELSEDTLAGFGNGRALIIIAAGGFHSQTYRQLKSLLSENGVKMVVASTKFAEATGDDGKTTVAVQQSLNEFPNLDRVRFSNLFDYVFVVGGNVPALKKQSGRDLKDILEKAVQSGSVVTGLSPDTREILELSGCIQKMELKADGTYSCGTLENAGSVAVVDELRRNQLPTLFRKLVAFRLKAPERTFMAALEQAT